MSQEPREPQEPTSDEDGPLTVRDDQLPDDVRPESDNPLAEPADGDVPDDLLQQDAARAGSGEDSEDASSGDDDASGTSSSTTSSESGDDPDAD